MHSTLRWTFAALMALAFAAPPAARACANPVRDMALTEWPRDMGVLYLVYKKEDETTKKWKAMMEKAYEGYLRDANLGFMELDAGQESFDPKNYDLKEVPAELPCVVALFWDNMAERGLTELARFSGEPDEAKIKSLIDSPLREKMRAELIKKAGVAIFAKSGDVEADKKARAALDEGIAVFKKNLMHEIAVFEIDRAKAEEQGEGYLLKQLGARNSKEPAVCVAFGRGKVVHGTLVGKDINPDNLWYAFSAPLGDCFCTVTPQMIGYDLIMPWPQNLNETFVKTNDLQAQVAKGMGVDLVDPELNDAMVREGPQADVEEVKEKVAEQKVEEAKKVESAEKEPEKAVAAELAMEPAAPLAESGSEILLIAVGAALIFFVIAAGALVLGSRKNEAA
ncbi:MAG: hypothetical protein L6R28_19740 [Planctomycetes bacterium]|nr:hypothetical protein [Planctomycetota bacterium]